MPNCSGKLVVPLKWGNINISLLYFGKFSSMKIFFLHAEPFSKTSFHIITLDIPKFKHFSWPVNNNKKNAIKCPSLNILINPLQSCPLKT